ncbi:MAG: ABC transporter ATP-binding protein [Deltaproteobacteria bacterium]|nr:ABC transporter ATP-binding protein [Deltaproteobacteria bacterium]MBW2008658.1 ABC transporter ATP-binding protein [Deltaproteobacteria bacterium]
MLLSVEKVNTFYGISHILFDISMQVAEGEVVCLLGRNGVGKTTVLKSIMGLAPARSGSILFMGSEIRGRRPFEIARVGIGFVPEDRIIFPDLTVKENLEMGVNRKIQGPWVLGRVFEAFPILEKRQSQMGGTLSGGEQQMLTIARTLMGNPRLLLLDEPSEGLSPLIVRELGSQIELLKNEGMPILLSEQNSGFTLKLSDRAYILEKGRIQWIGSVSELKEDPGIMKKYLGV